MLRFAFIILSLLFAFDTPVSAQWCSLAPPSCGTDKGGLPAIDESPAVPTTGSVQSLFQSVGVPEAASTSSLSDHNTTYTITPSEFASGRPGTQSAPEDTSLFYSPTLGEPLISFNVTTAVTGLFGKVEANTTTGSEFSNPTNYSVNVPVGPANIEMGVTGVKSIGLGVHDPTGIVAGAEVGTNINTGINVYISANLFNMKAKATASPGPGMYNAAGELERAIYNLYGVPWHR
jgi:hypothetical protein